ncbi:MAG TPA: hypothetical protein VLI68_11985 [Hanamia sp.]|jgi:hypothetical protein|nr:hypothetical protein [Hanamia sp.]
MIKYFIGSCFILLLLSSCKKENGNFTSASINDYFPLQVGKYITYDLDSTVYYINFGEKAQIIHYQAQYRVDSQLTDNSGRPAFNISRYLRSDSTQPWQIDNVFTAVLTGKSIEYIEDNNRFIKLMMPVKEGFTWKGNSYLSSFAYSIYSSSNNDFIKDWDYTYDSIGVPLTINTITIDSTLKVFETDEKVGDPALQPNGYADRNYSVEKYGKGIGLIYREFLHWEYQPVSSQSPGYIGFGIKMSITDHN